MLDEGTRCSVVAVSHRDGAARVRWEDSAGGAGAGGAWVDVTRLRGCAQ